MAAAENEDAIAAQDTFHPTHPTSSHIDDESALSSNTVPNTNSATIAQQSPDPANATHAVTLSATAEEVPDSSTQIIDASSTSNKIGDDISNATLFIPDESGGDANEEDDDDDEIGNHLYVLHGM